MTTSSFAAPTCGPTSRLVALPQLAGGLPARLADVDGYLAELERARQYQLDTLPARPASVVTAAHRRLVEQMLAEIRGARERVRAGTYGRCTWCRAPVDATTLDRVPWQSTCVPCASVHDVHPSGD